KHPVLRFECLQSVLGRLLCAAGNTTALLAGGTSQLAVREKAASATELTATGTDLCVKVSAVLCLVGCGSSFAASFGSSHKISPPLGLNSTFRPRNKKG